jgi:ATP synthase protein I
MNWIVCWNISNNRKERGQCSTPFLEKNALHPSQKLIILGQIFPKSNKHMTRLGISVRKQLYKILFWQLVMILGLAVVITLLLGKHKGISIILGGLACWLPTLVFLWRVSAYVGARAAMRFMVAFFVGEMVKLFLSGVLFVLAVKYLSIDVLYGLIGLIGAIVAFWIASITPLLSFGGKA